MASTQALKSRIRSVKSTKQITRAMQMVAASKMRRAQDAVSASDPYTRVASEILTYLASQGVTDDHPLFKVRPVDRRLIIVVAADKGLAGAYNSNVLKTYIQQLESDKNQNVKNSTIAIGRKASSFVSRLKTTEVTGVFENLPDQPSGSEFQAVMEQAYRQFTNGMVDAVDVIYTRFISSINQTVEVKRILPAGFESTSAQTNITDALYEPDINTVLNGITYRLVGAQIFQALLDARASEHSMRMLAMKNATDNANDLVDDLTLEMNKARQARITQELAEISGGVEALNE